MLREAHPKKTLEPRDRTVCLDEILYKLPVIMFKKLKHVSYDRNQKQDARSRDRDSPAHIDPGGGPAMFSKGDGMM